MLHFELSFPMILLMMYNLFEALLLIKNIGYILLLFHIDYPTGVLGCTPHCSFCIPLHCKNNIVPRKWNEVNILHVIKTEKHVALFPADRKLLRGLLSQA